MSSVQAAEFLKTVERHGRSRTALMDILRDIQRDHSNVSPQAITLVAKELGIPRWEVSSFVAFYDFLTPEPTGRVVIRVCDDVVDRMKGYSRVMDSFRKALDISPGETTADGLVTLTTAPCIGMCDQAPAALVNDVPVTDLATDKVWQIVRELKAHGDPKRLVKSLGDGNNAHPLVHSMVRNNLHVAGLLFSPQVPPQALRRAVSLHPAEVIRAIKTARLRGRGGAGFPTGMKLEFARSAPGTWKFVFCNADEGEPGTFKDRVLLTERPDRVFAGLTIAGYAVGAKEGVVYLRGEYAYLLPFLENVLERRRADGLLGKDVAGKKGFDFDIRIQMGAGAYVCGEESSLLNSAEGRAGDPRNRPPFPAQRGFLASPTVVNNVETLACITKILEEGPTSFTAYGTQQSTGTKLLSVSGDCLMPGTFELPFGITIRELLEKAGASDAQAVQVGGPSGRLIGPKEYDRRICFDDLATGGAVVTFGPDRDLLTVVRAYQAFFSHESCGYCTPCRAGNGILEKYLDRVLTGQGEPADLRAMERAASTMKRMSRCGLGQTACNPVLTSMENFPELYQDAVSEHPEGFRRSFDLTSAVAGHEALRRAAPPDQEQPERAD
ncbi:MAG TPA: NAD(P)H-dependent oxidoreductase subunit E [Longimicrobiales bacterium]|nr:NAD(P)H-dependent oxidoreductase subunit E [Longimicrobiales bacterium]